MSQTRVKKKKARKKTIMLFLAFLMIYLIIRLIPLIFGSHYKTILPVEDILLRNIEASGILIKDEYVSFSESSGQIEKLVKEGERVNVGKEIARISLLKDNSSLKQELLEVEQKIDTLKKSNTQMAKLARDKTKLEEVKHDIVESIQYYIKNGNYLEVIKAKEEIIALNSGINNNFQQNTLLSQSIESLNETKKGLVEKIDKNNIRVYSSESGLVSYETDGFENVFLPKNFENYTYENLNFDEKSKEEIKSQINIGMPIFKIINNFEWYLAVKINNNKNIEGFKIGQAITIELLDKELRGNIIAINTSYNNSVLIIKFKEFLHEFYDIRFTDVRIIKDKIESHKIPVKSIIEIDDKKGVYIKEINGIVKFKQINVLDIIGDYAYIDKGDLNNIISIEGQDKYKTISLYDEIFIDPNSVKDGQILR